jgi:Uma2 family endonuclease
MSSRSNTTASGAADIRRARDEKTAVWARPRSGPTTFEDFCAIVREDQKADLIDGVIYMASPENIDANDLFVWLLTLINLYARKKKLGRVFGSRVACRLDDKNAPEPDIVFVGAKHQDRIRRGGVDGPPDLVLEIVSPESVERDYDKKRRQYQRFKIPEYWIVDEEEQKVTLLRLNARGKYRDVPPRKGVFHSKALRGFRLDPRWLWQDPRPDELDILEQLLES